MSEARRYRVVSRVNGDCRVLCVGRPGEDRLRWRVEEYADPEHWRLMTRAEAVRVALQEQELDDTLRAHIGWVTTVEEVP